MKDYIAHYQKTAKRPNFFLYYFFLFFIYLYVKIKCRFKVINKVPKLKKPYLVLFNHPSKLDFIYTYAPLWRHRVSTMAAYFYFTNHKLGTLIHHVGAYPKYLFASDVSAIKNTFKIIKKNGVVGMSPEGRLSPHGTLESFHASTAKLIKKLEIDVVLNIINGAYLTFPKWATNIRRGRVEVEFSHILKASDIKEMSEVDIEKVLKEKLIYDDFAWQEKSQVSFSSKKIAEGLEYILIRCPVCHALYTIKTNKNHLSCSHCGMEAKLNNKYLFESEIKLPNIRDWYMWQKEYENEHHKNDFILTSKVILKLPDPEGKGFKVVGEGYTSLMHDRLVYEGSVNGEEKRIDFLLSKIQVILFGANEDFEVYQNNTLYYFVPENIKECARYTILAEMFYRRLTHE